MGIPENAETIWDYLTSHGLSANAAAGILGNIEQESGGNPSAGVWPSNYGLIQWTPASEYFSSPPSLQQQLAAIISYINANGSIAAINAAATSPSAAALYFSENYERPDPALANNANREQSAIAVAQAAASGNWPSGAVTASPVTTDTGVSLDFSSVFDVVKDTGTFIHDSAEALNLFFQFFKPGQDWRVAAGLVSVATGYLSFALYTGTGIDIGKVEFEPGENLPMAFLLGGISVMGLFMALRPWPEPDDKPIRPAAYAVDMFKGDIPSGPPTEDDTSAIEMGLTGILTIWLLSKAAGAATTATGILGQIGQFIGSLFGLGSGNSGEGGIPAEVPAEIA